MGENDNNCREGARANRCEQKTEKAAVCERDRHSKRHIVNPRE